MTILVTAFDTYDSWDENSSWSALTEYLGLYGAAPDLRTRRYPVNLAQMRERLEADLARGVDGVIHLGQRPGGSAVQLEAVALNVAGTTRMPGGDFPVLVDDAPLAFRTHCPLGLWCEQLKQRGIPSEVSYHAGIYLCNALMYLSHWWLHCRSLQVPVVFVHLPLTGGQVSRLDAPQPALDVRVLAETVRVLVELMRRTAVNPAAV